MESNKKLVTFELKDLSYDELLSVYGQINEFLSFLETSKVEITKKGKDTEEESEEKETTDKKETPEKKEEDKK